MLKETIAYIDYNGVERKETFYFNISESEALEMEMGTEGGYSELIRKIIDTQDMPTLIHLWKEFVLKAYGEKSLDGKYLMKLDENGRPLSAKFAQTEAFNVLYMKLATDSNYASNFVNSVLPKEKKEPQQN